VQSHMTGFSLLSGVVESCGVFGELLLGLSRKLGRYPECFLRGDGVVSFYDMGDVSLIKSVCYEISRRSERCLRNLLRICLTGRVACLFFSLVVAML